ncbi:MAG: hypothetical protein NVSMB68_12670 [Thermoanaerobaculia bacterium]
MTEALVKAFAQHEIEPRIGNAIEFARTRSVLLSRHAPTAIGLDVSLAYLPFEEEALGIKQARDFGGVTIDVAAPESLLVYKLIAGRPHDLDDAERLLLLYGATVRIDRLRALMREFAQALEDDRCVQDFERLLAKTKLK